SVLLGAPAIVHPRFDPAAVAAEQDQAFVSLVPTMLVRLLDAGADLSRFRAILVGGATVPPKLAERARAEGAKVIETYGLTESCGGVVYDGRALPGTEVRIDGDGGIQLRGPTVMRGYFGDAQATAEAFTDGGWLRPGDAGWIDGEGRLRVAGRLDGLSNTGGSAVWPGREARGIGRGYSRWENGVEGGRRTQRDRPGIGACRLHGGPVRRPRRPAAPRPEGSRRGWSAHADHRRRELPGLPRGHPRAGAHERHGEAGLPVRRRDVAPVGDKGGPVRPPLRGVGRRRGVAGPDPHHRHRRDREMVGR